MKFFVITFLFLFNSPLFAAPEMGDNNKSLELNSIMQYEHVNCDGGRFAIRVIEVYGEFHYYAWDKSAESDIPYLMLHGGKHTTGRAADHYDFYNGKYRYQVLAFFEGRGGYVNINIYKNNKVIYEDSCGMNEPDNY